MRQLAAVLLTGVKFQAFSPISGIGPPFGEDLCIPPCILLREGCKPALLWHDDEGVYSVHWSAVLTTTRNQIHDRTGVSLVLGCNLT